MEQIISIVPDFYRQSVFASHNMRDSSAVTDFVR